MEAAAVAALSHSGIVACSFAMWCAVSLAVHVITCAWWKGYAGLTRLEQRQWCNKWTSGLHAGVLAACQARNLLHPALLADPLGLAASPPPFHYFWACVLTGYLLYDTAYGLLFYPLSTAAPFLLHHVIGLGGCALGVVYGRLALFGLAIEVWFEGTTPLLHVVGCMKIAKRQGTQAYQRLAAAFAAQFLVFRLLIANGYLAWLLARVLQLEAAPAWAWAGVGVFAALSCLNAFWFAKIVNMARGSGKKLAASGRAGRSQGSSNAQQLGNPAPASPLAGAAATFSIAGPTAKTGKTA